jgi:tRNA A-37 threonylcarbamoyl transferase component Bud32
MPSRIDMQALKTWLREEMAESDAVTLGQGYQASVRRVATPFGDYVLKCPHRHRLLGRLMRSAVAREADVYRRIAGIPGIPACQGLVDAECLVLEFVPGASFRQMQHEIRDRDAFFAALLETLRRMHAAGVAHGDLKRKDNILVGPGERPYIIDFGIASLRHADAGRLNQLWFEMFKQMDYNAWIKLKYGRKPEKLSAADGPLYRELWIERAVRLLRRLTPPRKRP